MATKKKPESAPRKQYTLGSQSDLLVEENTGDLAERCLRIYGEEVNLNRSVPDLRDGLKPVGRRILYALSTMPRKQLIKTARLSGEVIGKYHPHGSASVDGAVTTSVVSCTPPITGVGNWGSLIDPPGASRYTNVLMSEYGETFFHRNFTPQTVVVPNYDDKDTEPLFLPALLPNLLLNGAQGIGLGLTTSIPAFTPDSLLPVLAEIAEGNEPDVKSLSSRLTPYHQYGGEFKLSKENKLAMENLLTTTGGSLEWSSPIEVDEDRKKVSIRAFAPEVNPISLVEKRLKPMPEVASVHSGAGVSYTVSIRKDVNTNSFRKFVEKFTKLTSSKISYEFYVTLSKADSEGKKSVKFYHMTLLQMMQTWVKYRISLEKKSLEWRLGEIVKRDTYLKLLLRACDALDIIFKALRSKDPKEGIMKGMGLTDAEADIILNLKVKQLSKLDQEQIEAEREKLASQTSELKKLLKSPQTVVANFLREYSTKFVLTKNDCSIQYILK